jgi:hypothetical protein
MQAIPFTEAASGPCPVTRGLAAAADVASAVLSAQAFHLESVSAAAPTPPSSPSPAEQTASRSSRRCRNADGRTTAKRRPGAGSWPGHVKAEEAPPPSRLPSHSRLLQPDFEPPRRPQLSLPATESAPTRVPCSNSHACPQLQPQVLPWGCVADLRTRCGRWCPASPRTHIYSALGHAGSQYTAGIAIACAYLVVHPVFVSICCLNSRVSP